MFAVKARKEFTLSADRSDRLPQRCRGQAGVCHTRLPGYLVGFIQCNSKFWNALAFLANRIS